MRTQQLWTLEETTFVKEHYRTMPAREMAEQLHRTKVSVKGHLEYMGLNAQTKWSVEETEQLRQLRESGKTLGQISKQLNRTEFGIKSKLNKEKIHIGNCMYAERWQNAEATEKEALIILPTLGFQNIKECQPHSTSSADFIATRGDKHYGINVIYSGSTHIGIRASNFQRMLREHNHVAFLVKLSGKWFWIEPQEVKSQW